MKKNLISFLLAISLLLCMAVPAYAAVDETGFSDVTADAWYADAVKYVREKGLMSGTSANMFSPDQTMTRAMLAVVLYRIAGSPVVSGNSPFADVNRDSWCADAVNWASRNNIISGYGNGLFGVNHPVTREQLATILWRYAGSPVGDSGNDFADEGAISSYATSAVDWARANGIISGKSGNIFDPNGNASRAQVAAILMRYHIQNQEHGSEPTPEFDKEGNMLVAYFSCTGTTENTAEQIADITGGTLFEIVPEQPYTSADLAYYTNGRADREQNDPTARPVISNTVQNMDDFDVIFLGYPIWHGQAPRIISTFLESYDFSGKTIVPFCTSHSSGIGSSDTNLHALAPEANWLPGRRFASNTSHSSVKEWIGGLDLPKADTAASLVRPFDFISKTVTLNSGYKMPINGLGTYSLHGETCVNSVKAALASGVRLIDTASAYGNEKEVGQAIRESMEELGITREEIFVITKIYPGSEMANPEQSIQACLDRLDIGYVDMMLLHHPDANDVKAYQSMEQFVAEGKIRSIGLSNWYVEELEEFLPQVNITPALVQNEIHPYYQENDVIPYIQNLGIVVQGWYPLGGRGHTGELLGDKVISAIADAHGVSSAQVILRWNLQKGVVVIPGSSNPDHIQENTELYHFALTEEEMARINALDRGEKHDWY